MTHRKSLFRIVLEALVKRRSDAAARRLAAYRDDCCRDFAWLNP